MNDERIILDLEQHFARRLSLEVQDIGATCQHADIDIEIILKLVISGLFYELLRASKVAGWDEPTFLHACKIAYRTIMPQLKPRSEP